MVYRIGEREPVLGAGVWVAPEAVVLGDVVLAPDVSIWYGAVLRGDLERIEIGKGSNVQDGSVIHTDHGIPCVVGSDVTVGHRVVLHSATVGDGCLVGMGAILLGGCVLGEGCIVAAGALVPEGKKFPPRSLLLGIPARAVRSVSDEEAKGILENALLYRRLALGAGKAAVLH